MDNHTNTLELFLQQLEQKLQKQIYADALSILIKVLTNISTNPLEDKFRHLKITNKALNVKLYSVEGMKNVLQMIGFLQQNDEWYLPDTNLGQAVSSMNVVRRQEILTQASLVSDQEYQKAKELVKRQKELERQQEEEYLRKKKLEEQCNYDKQERKYIECKDSLAKECKFGANVKKFEAPPQKRGR